MFKHGTGYARIFSDNNFGPALILSENMRKKLKVGERNPLPKKAGFLSVSNFFISIKKSRFSKISKNYANPFIQLP